jgi:hypothetical protein
MDGTEDGVSLFFGGLDGFFTGKVLDRRMVLSESDREAEIRYIQAKEMAVDSVLLVFNVSSPSRRAGCKGQ